MIVITRFRVPEAETAAFVAQAEAAIAVLRQRGGLRSLDFARNLDEQDLWTITARWEEDRGLYLSMFGWGVEGQKAKKNTLANRGGQ